MFSEIGIERGIPINPGVVMFDYLFERGEAAIMHVRGSNLDVAQRGHGEFGFVAFFAGDQKTSEILGLGIQSVVSKSLILEKRAAMAMKTIRSELFPARIVFGVKQFKTALLFSGELRLTAEHVVEFRIKRGLREQKLFESSGDAICRNLRSAECASEESRVGVLITAKFRHDIRECLVHFDRVLERLKHLLAK